MKRREFVRRVTAIGSLLSTRWALTSPAAARATESSALDAPNTSLPGSDAAHAATELEPPVEVRDRRSPFLVIEDVSVFDSRAEQMLPGRSVLLQDDRIEAVEPADRLAVPEGTMRLRGEGRFLIPGLVDAHVHLTHILYQSRMTGDEILPFFLGHGVTSVRSTGDNVPAQKLIANWADAHPEVAPRVFRCSFLIDGQPPWHRDIGWALTDPDDVPAFVEHMAAWGVDSLKLYVGVERPVGRRVIEEAHPRGLVVSGHLLNYHAADAVADGIDCLEHIYTVSNFLLANPDDRHSIDLTSDTARRLIDLIAERETWVDPTLMVFWGTLLFVDRPEVIGHPDNEPMPARLRAFWEEDRRRRLADWGAAPIETRLATFATYQQLVGMLHRAGVRLLVGTDAPEPQVPPGSSLHHEMELLVASGLTPAEVLARATLENARVLGREEDLGMIEPGRLADLVLLEADPVEDIRNTRRIRRVFRGGTPLEPAAILAAAPRA